jgi:hypothetical protein
VQINRGLEFDRNLLLFLNVGVDDIGRYELSDLFKLLMVNKCLC